jgi:methionine-rich copper-binding protein CopC
MKSTSWMSRVVLAVVAALALTVFVQAHTKLEKSIPADGATVTAAPPSVQLFFNEKLDLKVSKIEISGPSGKVEVGPAHTMAEKDIMTDVKGALGNGKYTVAWQTAGADGHVQKGTISFTVQKAQ